MMMERLRLMQKVPPRRPISERKWPRYCSEGHEQVGWNGTPGCWVEGCSGMGYTVSEQIEMEREGT